MTYDLKGRIGVVYKSLWEGKEFPNIEIVPTSEKSNNSYKILGKEGQECLAIQKAFGIANVPLFQEKYERAVSGNGDEAKKILTMHSSSRCALLVFYNISEENPLTLELEDAAGKLNQVTFTESTFEFKNPVIGYPSNMDVVLLGKDEKGKNTVLFLESKFSEYYMGAETEGAFISDSYRLDKKDCYSKDLYSDETLQRIGLISEDMSMTRKDSKGEEKTYQGFKLKTEDGSYNYLEGIKQMISHYYGVRRRMAGASITADENPETREIYKRVLDIVRDGQIYLGEILFDSFYRPEGYEQELDPQMVLENYSRTYEKLAKEMNRIIADCNLADRFIVLQHDLKYSKVLKQVKKLEKVTEDFYRGA